MDTHRQYKGKSKHAMKVDIVGLDGITRTTERSSRGIRQEIVSPMGNDPSFLQLPVY
jgi:hypothetical protein